MRSDHGIGKDAGCAKCAKTSLPFAREWRYGEAASRRQWMHAEFKEQRSSQNYEVLGSDSESVAVMHWNLFLERQSIQHIHFVGDDHCWIAIGRQREWFRRVYNA